MANKIRWSPLSRVNTNHVTGMIAKGDADYKSWVSRIFGADADTFHSLIMEGEDKGYLHDENVDTLLGSPRAVSEKVKAAASETASIELVRGLLAAKQEGAIKALLATGTVTEEIVAKAKSKK